MSSDRTRLLCLLFLALLFISWPGGAHAVVTGDQSSKEAPADLYAADPAPLKPDQCGQCHTRHFGDLKQSGGRHRFDCRDCHQVIHAYNPVRGNYAELMPKCTQCHTLPHGAKHDKCLDCHANPHAAAVPPALSKVQDRCAECHAGPAQELKELTSRHSQQKCQSCHRETHGFIPSCGDCHRPHFSAQTMDTCTQCHPVHRPLQIKLAPDTKPDTCRQCHAAIVEKWSGSKSKHGQVACAACHTRHGFKPECQSCHGTPHDQRQLSMFPRCLDCHLDVHDLPVKRK